MSVAWRRSIPLLFLIGCVVVIAAGLLAKGASGGAVDRHSHDRLRGDAAGAPCAGQNRLKHVSRLDTGGRRKPYNRIRPFGDQILAYGWKHDDEFADAWINWGPRFDPENEQHPGRIRFKVAFTNHLALHARRISKLVPPRTPMHFLRAESSYRELMRLQRKMVREMFPDPPAFDPGGEPNGMGIDSTRNMIEVSLGDYSDEAAEAIRQRYGPAVCVPAFDSPAPVPGRA